MEAEHYDVVVVGCGNAALAAAAAADENGARVLIIEQAPLAHRGGNSRLTGAAEFRFPYNEPQDVKLLLWEWPLRDGQTAEIPPYTQDDFYGDMMRVTLGRADPKLIELLVNESYPVVKWMAGLGIQFELFFSHHVVRTGDHFRWPHGTCVIHAKGGGEGLIASWLAAIEKKRIEVRYETRAVSLLRAAKCGVKGVIVEGPQGLYEIQSRGVVLACGGFEASPEMRARYLGVGTDLAKVRGTRYNTGHGLHMALEQGAKAYGHWSGFHCSPIDAGAPDVEAQLMGADRKPSYTLRYSYPLGIMVNTKAERFLDEAEDFSTYTYAKTGASIVQQPGGTAYQIFDSKVKPYLADTYELAVPTVAGSIEELAEMLDLRVEALLKTVREFNEAVMVEVPLDRSIRDGKGTRNISPPKSNWAQTIDAPPYYAYAVTGGVTFTYAGLKIDGNGRVLDLHERPIPGLYAAGELTGGFFYFNYPGGTGLVRGAVTGCLAGRAAATIEP
ncbi:MAG: FAD-dependent tricarballylate dehydrogenase TcuA [Deltaproteobacteria bacterium]|nr:FAD-dependent tricarballylate dehydrogenase TcuA [Deltaproteobacteria bacterium]